MSGTPDWNTRSQPARLTPTYALGIPERSPVPLVAIYLLASVILVPFVASSKGRSGLAWVVIALLMSPLLAILGLIAVPPGEGREPINPFDVDRTP